MITTTADIVQPRQSTVASRMEPVKMYCCMISMNIEYIFSFTDYSVHMYGGDIALTPEQQATLEATSNQISPFSIQNAVVRSEQYIWKDGIVYYIFDESLGEYIEHNIHL